MTDIIIMLLIASIIGFTLYRSIKKRKSGGGGCAGCSGSCNQFNSCDTKKT